MDAIDIIKNDHRAIRRLFARFDGLEKNDQQGQKTVVSELVALLHRHAAVEEDIFYPEVAKAEAEPTEKMQDSADEHEHIDQMVDELAELPANNPHYRERFMALKQTMMQHMKEEEREVLPAAEQNMNERQRDAIGQSMRDEQRAQKEMLN